MKTKNTLLTLASVGALMVVSTASTFANETTTSTNATVTTSTTVAAAPVVSLQKLTKPEREALRSTIKKNFATISANWQMFHTDEGYLRTYLKTDLSKADKKAFKVAHKKYQADARATYNAKIKDLKARYTDTNIDTAALKTELYALVDSQMASFTTTFTPYIATDKTAAFAKFVTSRTTTMKANIDLRIVSITNRLILKNSHK